MTADPKRILITGYNGFVAPHLVAACARRYPSAQYFGLVHAASQAPIGAEPAERGRSAYPIVTEVEGDITDGAGLRRILHETQPDLVFHLAAVSSVAASWQDPANVLRVNAGGFIQLAEAVLAESLAPRIVVVGSGEQYGPVHPDMNPVAEDTLLRPINPYAVAKVAQDLYAFQYYKAYDLNVVRARPFNHFGPGQSADFVIASFARQIALIEAGQAAPILLVGNLSAQRDFLPVDDVAQAYLALAERGLAGEAYNIGSGVARSIESLLRMLLGMSTVKVEIRVDPQRFRPIDAPAPYADTTKIRHDTGWSPVIALDEALRATLDAWRKEAQTRLASR